MSMQVPAAIESDNHDGDKNTSPKTEQHFISSGSKKRKLQECQRGSETKGDLENFADEVPQIDISNENNREQIEDLEKLIDKSNTCEKRTKVGLFGSSFDPPTGDKGHRGIVKCLSPFFDQLWLLPVYQHPYESKHKRLSPFDIRYEMTRLCFQEDGIDQSKIKVSGIEREVFEELNPNPAVGSISRHGTIDVIKFLQAKYPNYDFFFIVGQDTFYDLSRDKWRNGEDLVERIKFVVVSRKGFLPESFGMKNCPLLESEHADQSFRVAKKLMYGMNYVAVHLPLQNFVSSTQARNTNDYKKLVEIVGPAVANFIRANHLFAYRPI